jgi:hypothetical protein
MTTKHLRIAAITVLLQFGALAAASAAPPSIGTTFPDHFPVIRNFYLGAPVIGFGSNIGRAEHVPVIFLHGNNDTPSRPPAIPSGASKPSRNSSSITATVRASCGGSAIKAISATCCRTIPIAQASRT